MSCFHLEHIWRRVSALLVVLSGLRHDDNAQAASRGDLTVERGKQNLFLITDHLFLFLTLCPIPNKMAKHRQSNRKPYRKGHPQVVSIFDCVVRIVLLLKLRSDQLNLNLDQSQQSPRWLLYQCLDSSRH